MIGAGTKLGSNCGGKGATWVGPEWVNGNPVGGSDELETGLACSLRGLKSKDRSFMVKSGIVETWTPVVRFRDCVPCF